MLNKFGKILWVVHFSLSIILAGCFAFVLIAIPSSRIPANILLTVGGLVAFSLWAFFIWCLRKEFSGEVVTKENSQR